MVVATIATIEVPLGTLEACPEIVELCLEIGEIGLQASLSDAGTGAAMARAAASGAYQNVCINLPGLTDRQVAAALRTRADAAWMPDERARGARRVDLRRRIAAGGGLVQGRGGQSAVFPVRSRNSSQRSSQTRQSWPPGTV